MEQNVAHDTRWEQAFRRLLYGNPWEQASHEHARIRLARNRLWQGNRKAEEAKRINQQGGGEETENHSIFLSEASTVKRAV